MSNNVKSERASQTQVRNPLGCIILYIHILVHLLLWKKHPVGDAPLLRKIECASVAAPLGFPANNTPKKSLSHWYFILIVTTMHFSWSNKKHPLSKSRQTCLLGCIPGKKHWSECQHASDETAKAMEYLPFCWFSYCKLHVSIQNFPACHVWLLVSSIQYSPEISRGFYQHLVRWASQFSHLQPVGDPLVNHQVTIERLTISKR